MVNDIDFSYCDFCYRGNIENKIDYQNFFLWDEMLKMDYFCFLFVLI